MSDGSADVSKEVILQEAPYALTHLCLLCDMVRGVPSTGDLESALISRIQILTSLSLSPSLLSVECM